jgi:hypothetical protein
MGRPLKIKNISETSYNSSTGANPGVDIGFNPFSALTAPVVPIGFTPGSATEYEGVVGGSNTVDSANYPTVKCRVRITGFAEEDGYIITQKGAHKFLVGGTTARTALVSGTAYRITVVGDTDWAAYGVTGTPTVGGIFTATAALGNTGTGRVNAVGVCILADQADTSLSAGNMNITFTLNDSTARRISKLTNKFILDFTGGSTYAATSVVNDVRYAANFFTDEGTVIKSGTTGSGNTGTQQNLLDLGIVENYNS